MQRYFALRGLAWREEMTLITRHSFIRMTKLTDVRGRVDYISNPKRQEHLYAVWGTAKPEYWEYLSRQAQFEFWRSNQKTGKCIEARELIIALPESLQSKDPEKLLQLFAATFSMEYGVDCVAALHHNKAMTNYHIHLIFADREPLEKTEVRYASRNMFYDENGRHVRTKKEILDEDGQVRPGCRILAKGEIYDVKWFSGRKEIFKSKEFLPEVKRRFTDLINSCVEREEDRVQVFNPEGPYLPTKKIGKNNPLAEEIRRDNELRQEWNRTVDQVLIAGGSQEEVAAFKKEEVVDQVAETVRKNGRKPELFADLLRRAIAILKEFLAILMKSEEKAETTRELQTKAKGQTAQSKRVEKKEAAEAAELRLMKIRPIHEKLCRTNRKLYALQNQQQILQKALDVMPRSLFNRKDRKALQERIDGIGRQIETCRTQLEFIPTQYGFGSVGAAEAEYRSAKKQIDQIRNGQDNRDGKIPSGNNERPSALEELRKNRRDTDRVRYERKTMREEAAL